MDQKLNQNFKHQVVRYPDPAVEALDSSFNQYMLGSAALERLWTGARWTEGPVWFGDGRFLLFSDIPNNRMLKWSEETQEVSVYRNPSNNSNGNTRDTQGRLLTCEHGSRSVTRTEYDGSITVLADSFQGCRLNAPNDIVVHPDGGIWFTDPGYGIIWNYEGNKAAFELPTNVYRIDPISQELEVVTSDLEKPNGLCFSPDYSKLYISDTGVTHKAGHPRVIEVFDVNSGRTLSNRQVFFDLGDAMPDGFRVDIDGNIWTSAGWAGEGGDGVIILSPAAKKIGMIHTPEPVSNLCFGGAKRNRLFITAGQSLYSLYTDAQGVGY
ncbi:MAG: SMP-30/gluconolactonase/LRE family protein [Gammaproteobacteria bacterium]|nr:SMP-30/gluconolactonase/LRE family protein [Gammaproteobacteria bacterium]MBT5204687.1 SMP-30/gluconolactonase/LRE family protein [Gammaproteobacteria bacterium]MBT5601971.1 SMP-30/gluconolactonase/LRE family protein [Gammaproteobacteria bacterium]MBT6243890.1 SMP-30/gluconolactonase/LRE family protein [Gammaproteobacteria bacterium]